MSETIMPNFGERAIALQFSGVVKHKPALYHLEEEPSEWISVADALPPMRTDMARSDRVLTANAITGLVFIARLAGKDETPLIAGKWCFEMPYLPVEDQWQSLETVSHWMPLPEKPYGGA